MTEKFWMNDLSVLLNKKYITNIIPENNQSLNEKLNSITRLVILLTIIGYILTRSLHILFLGLITITIIVIYYQNNKGKDTKETFINSKKFSPFNKEINNKNYTMPTKNNPFMNVMLPELSQGHNRKNAAPSYNEKVEKEINNCVKDNLDNRIFQDLGDNITFNRQMRNYITMPNTQIPNDQKSFCEFLYGDMPSCKDGDYLQCDKNNYRYILR
jgi:hypothetical protein